MDGTAPPMTGRVLAVACHGAHGFSKPPVPAIALLAGRGVAGDAHCGETVKHRSRVAVDPTQPNLRQLHLLPGELLEELGAKGFAVPAGGLGENVLTAGLDLIALPEGTRLRLGERALVALTGLRNPCRQIEIYRPGLLAAVLGRDAAGGLVRKAGVMAVVLEAGEVKPGDSIAVTLPPPPHRRLERV